MKISYLLMTVAPFALMTPAHAKVASTAAVAGNVSEQDAAPVTKRAVQSAAESDTVSTGVARARDRLDSATSTSSLKQSEISKMAPRSLGEIFSNIPGMRAEAAGGEGGATVGIRGLPVALGGAKLLQLQEDGLPTLEFGDIAFATADNFIRADLSLAQVDSIRGGSASTFSSNSPGGIINFISKTGEVEGGSIQATAGLDYEEYRMDFDYGAKISDTLRFNVGGFYRQGEGPRAVGYDGFKGGQFKVNVTKTFDGGYIRFYGKLLDDRTPYYRTVPLKVTGTDANPSYQNLPGFDYNKDTLQTRNFLSNLTLGQNNTVERHDLTDGQHAKVKSIGVETQFEIGDWNVTEKFRFSSISGSTYTPFIANTPFSLGDAQAVGNSLVAQAGLTGPATLSYATGPNAGQVIANPAAINGNGLLARITNQDVRLNSLDYVVNDIRISRVWDIGNDDLTTTFGFYKSSQTIDTTWTWTSIVTDVVGGGNSNLVNITAANGTPVTQSGYYSFGTGFIGGVRRSQYDLTYGVNAPYASFNYHSGKISVGGSIRYDYGTARGSIYGSDQLDPRVRFVSRDINGDGAISNAETRVSYLPLTNGSPINYNYHYTSYSTGINYRVAEPFALFARYSKGGRANADRLMFGNFFNNSAGTLIKQESAFDPVQQAEVGAKYRKNGVTLNLTGFWAKTKEHNVGLDRRYRAYGLEFEGGIRKGPWNLTASATYTKADITEDLIVASTVGNTPRHQPNLIYTATPQYSTDNFSVGAVIIGTTSSYAADINQLKLPAYTTVNAFVQFRPVERLLLSLNSNNLFNAKGFNEADYNSIPANGIITARSINGRTISTSVRFDF